VVFMFKVGANIFFVLAFLSPPGVSLPKGRKDDDNNKILVLEDSFDQ